MDRNTILRWMIIAGAILLFWKYGMPLITGKKDAPQALPAEVYTDSPAFVPDAMDPPAVAGTPNKPSPGEACKIHGNRFDADLSTRGAALTHFMLRDSQYAGTDGFDMSTTPDHERWRSLRTLFRTEGAVDDQFKYDRFDWKLDPSSNDKACIFTYADDLVSVTKKVSAGDRPFELNVETTIKNLADAPKKHAFSTEIFAFRLVKDMKGNLGRQSAFVTEVSCANDKDVVRKARDNFHDGWGSFGKTDRYAAINTTFFSQALLVPPGTESPSCSLVAEDWNAEGVPADDAAASLFRARLSYAQKELAPGASATYKEIAFFGPKERDVLAKAGGGTQNLSDVVNLGFFSPVARVLTSILIFFHSWIGNWGIAIIVMTVCLKLGLFPLTWKSIKSSIEMRKLRPEVDALTAKFKDDAGAKNLAMMELWKKNGVSPFGGCLPQLVQMPVWFAMYTTLQTAVPMYHTSFLWFADLSAPDKFYILPILLGGMNILQQRLMPQQPGMDPMQQKMMTWMMPIVFTVMMLFLPAALGVYMTTNGILNIAQQLLIEQISPRSPNKKTAPGKGEIVVKSASDSGDSSGKSLPRGKARV